MTHRFPICLAIASLLFMAPRPARATNTPTTFDTIDAVALTYQGGSQGRVLALTGIVSGASTPTTLTFIFGGVTDSFNADMAGRCERYALMTMAKPGKYQLFIGPYDSTNSVFLGCKLILRTP